MSDSRFAVPGLVARLGRRLPAPLVSLHFVAGLELARRLNWLSPPPELEGRSFAITIEDLGLCSRFTVRGGVFRPMWNREACELALGAGVAELLALMRGETDADTLFFQRRLRISGDTELGLIVKNWLDAAPRPAWLRRLGAGVQ
ncbi:ubiquinone anaerobic biosynthesis accessory factor UbiT [Achromobacter ruhlandii]|uniref:ubiquinone anaerobic biosynthesis accessory factor UbiT n=1 Tax=Achromobacter ruhlandii TaxID=72557 RepID=UPI001EED2096|nr:SCP2 sterol-binding domain-containing protein [Achromobacter ruhlandii]MCZ8397542.1 SCP2 sterol-binding domain-containing protein [Achromobacter ruhlandii]